MEGDLKLAQDKQESNKTKQTLRKLMTVLDTDQSGAVRHDTFFMVLKMHKVTFSQQN